MKIVREVLENVYIYIYVYIKVKPDFTILGCRYTAGRRLDDVGIKKAIIPPYLMIST